MIQFIPYTNFFIMTTESSPVFHHVLKMAPFHIHVLFEMFLTVESEII